MLPTPSLMLRRLAAAALFCAAAASTASAEVSPRAEEIGPVTNSMLTAWGISLLLILGLKWVVGTPKLVPTRGQAVVETLLEGLRGLYGPIVGEKAMPMAFPLLICLFFFILTHNWSGLLPGVGTIGWTHPGPDGHDHFVPLIRPHNADLNGTLALAAISFGGWFIIVMRYAGFGVLIHDLFGNKADRKELATPIYAALSLIFLVVGCIEVFSIFIRPVTLSVRLFGNIFGGENLLHATWFTFPFYFLELLVGLVQAIVFTLLTAVYIGLICNHGEDHGAEHGKEEAHSH